MTLVTKLSKLKEADAKACYEYALYMKALAIGSRRFQTVSEMYWQEMHGVIP